MKYWTVKEFEQTQEKVNKINRVSKFWGVEPKDKRPVLLSYVDNMVQFVVRSYEPEPIINLDFSSL